MGGLRQRRGGFFFFRRVDQEVVEESDVLWSPVIIQVPGAEAVSFLVVFVVC